MFDYLAKDRRRLRRRTRAFAREVDAGQAKIFVDHGFQWDGANNVWLTRARASFVMGAGPAFDIRPRSFFSRVIGVTGGVSSGDPCFDDFFVVRTPDPDGTWRALTTRARSLLAGSFEDARVLSNGRMVTLWREGDFGREVDGDAAVEAVSEIVSFQANALEPLCRLPGAVYEAPEGGWADRSAPRITLHVPGEVVVAPAPYRGRAVLTATSACGRASTAFRIALDSSGRALGDEPVGETIRSAADRLGACTIRCDGTHLTVRWPALDIDRDRVATGVQLLASLSKSRSPYR